MFFFLYITYLFMFYYIMFHIQIWIILLKYI